VHNQRNGQNAAPPVAWTPTDEGAALLFWEKADAGGYEDAAKTTPATDDGDVIGAREDQSGQGNDATQGTTANKPTLQNAAGDLVNGLPVDLYDGIDDGLFIVDSANPPAATQALSDAITAFAVVSTNSVAAAGSYWIAARVFFELRKEGGTPYSVPFSLGVASGKFSLGVAAGTIAPDQTDRISSTASINNGSPHIVIARISGDDYSLYVDGNAANTGTFAKATASRAIGANNANWTVGCRTTDAGAISAPWDDRIMEIGLIANVTVSIDDIKTYLSGRWGVVV